MRKTFLIGVALLALAFAGFAAAEVTLTGDDNGSLRPGQTFTISVSDSISNAAGNGPTTAPYGWCGPIQVPLGTGWFSVGPLSPSGGGHMQSLAVSCTPDGANTGVWHYSGGITLTVPDDAPSSLSVSVAVEELIPMAALGATATYDYNFNRTYTVVRPITTSMTTGAGTTTAGSTTVAAPARTATSSTTTQTQTTATPAGTATSAATTTLTARKLVLHAPSTITIERPRAFVTILVTSNDRRSRQTLCWRHPPETRFACADGRGEWHARLRGSLGKEIFVLKIDGRVVAQASATFKLKR